MPRPLTTTVSPPARGFISIASVPRTNAQSPPTWISSGTKDLVDLERREDGAVGLLHRGLPDDGRGVMRHEHHVIRHQAQEPVDVPVMHGFHPVLTELPDGLTVTFFVVEHVRVSNPSR